MAHHDPGEQVGGRAFGLATAAAVLALTAGLFASLAQAALFWAALALFCAPGLALARRFLPSQAPWLAGAALGYLASSLLASVLFRLGLWSPAAVLLAPFVLAAAAHLGRSRSVGRPPSGDDRPWRCAALLFVVALTALPFLAVGAEVPGGVAYRAYFSADLMTHLSVVAELQKGSVPPVNPFYAGEALGYYWLLFLFPAAVGEWTLNEGALLSSYLASGMLFAGLLFAAARRLGLGARYASVAVVAGIGAAGYDGLLALAGRGPWTETNVDAFARWELGLSSLDGLHRSILYTPQHLFSYSLLVLLVLLVLEGEPRDRTTACVSGALLGGMAGASIVTAMLAGPWLVLVLFLRRQTFAGFLALAAWATGVSAAFLAWYVALGFFSGAGGAFLLRMPRPGELFSLLLIDCGALVLLVVGRRRLDRSELPLVLLGALALGGIFFLDLAGYEGVWMAWRAGSVLLVSLFFLAVPALRAPRPLHVLVLLPAALTLVLDVYNAQDVTNRSLSAGDFRWTTVLSRDEREALEWIRKETPEDATVQWDVRAREPGEWALVPAIGRRRMAVGFPIFLLEPRKYRARERREVRPIFLTDDAGNAHELAERLGIDYLFLGATEVRVRGERLRKLFDAPELFRTAFQNRTVTILEVVPR